MEKHYPAKHLEPKFHCVHCGVFAAQDWRQFYYQQKNKILAIDSSMQLCVCVHCSKWSYWYSEKMVIPSASTIPPPHDRHTDRMLNRLQRGQRNHYSVSKGGSLALAAGTPKVNASSW